MKHVAIIGGGLAGLSCAFYLKRRNIPATVFEAQPRAGGRDAAALFLLAPDLFKNTFQLIRDLGLGDEILPIPPHAGQVYKERIYHHRVASATGLLSFRGLGLADKAMLPRMAYLLNRYSPHLNFHHPEKGLEFDDETVASFVKRELSQNVLNYVAGPLISTLFFYGSEETSRWLYLVLAKHMTNTRMSTVRGGLQRVSDHLSSQLQVMKEKIESIDTDGDGCFVNGRRFSDVVVAVPGDRVLDIAGVDAYLSDDDRQFFLECQYQRTVSVTVATKEPADRNCYAVAIPRVEGYSAATIAFHDFIDSSRVPERRGLLTITGGGAEVNGAKLLSELQELYPIRTESTEITEWTSGTPKFPPGRYRRIHEFQQRQRKPGLFFCGDYLLGPCVEGAVTTGLRAANAIRV
ncbi:MAG TPA: FAD-dependent oxidoreductase [Terriglobia bacterium]|nr:FAD-dependent oxidoreductase [Terriglobia bacterium]